MNKPLPVACCLAAALLLAEQQPVFRGRVDLVAVDVHVVDKTGRPVADLRPEDFRITVDGKLRTIETADYVAHPVRLTPAPAPSDSATLQPLLSSNLTVASGPPARTVMLVVDESNIQSGSGRHAIAAAERFIDLLGPRDRIGLALIPYGHANIDPTTDHAVVKEALQHVVGRMQPAPQTGRFNLGLQEAFASMNNDRRTWAEAVRRECGKEGFPPGCNLIIESDARSIVVDARQRLVESLRSFQALFAALQQLPGPKTVVLLSEELPVAPYPSELADFIAESRRFAEAAARARASVYVLHLQTQDFDASTRHMPPTQMADSGIRSTGLENVTSLTGGTRLMIIGRAEVAFDRIALEVSGYYLLGFRAEAADRDGKPHNITVKVARPGVEVRARKMFAAGDHTRAVADATAADVVNRLLRTPVDATELPMVVSTYTVPEPGDGPPKVRVIISAEIDRAARVERALTVGFTIFDAKRKNTGASVEQATLKPASGHPDSPLCYQAAAVVPPGRYTLRLAAADADSRRGVVEHSFEASAIEVGELRLGDLIVLDPAPAEPDKARPSVSAALTDTLSGYLEILSRSPIPPTGTQLRLEVARTPTGPALVGGEMTLQTTTAANRYQAFGSVSLSDIQPGTYVGRVVVWQAGQPVAQVTRPFRVVAGAAIGARRAAAGRSVLDSASPAKSVK